MTVVLYDGKCGFCRWAMHRVLAWDRHHRLEPVALQSERGRELTADLDEEQRLASWHLVEDGERSSGGAAIPKLLRRLPGGRPAAWLCERFPRATDRGYRFVAGHRTAFGRVLSSSRPLLPRKGGRAAPRADRAPRD